MNANQVESQIDMINDSMENKHTKKSSLSHHSRANERLDDKLKPKSKLTREKLYQLKYTLLPDPNDKKSQFVDPDYHYMWLSKDPHAKPSYEFAVTELGYTPCTTVERPDFAMHVVKKSLDDSISHNEICVREMILCKILNEDYQLYMNVYHNEEPARAESDIRSNFDNGAAQRRGATKLNKFVFAEDDAQEKSEDLYSQNQPIRSVRIGNDGVVTKIGQQTF